MPRKRHPMFQAKAGTVFAVRINAACWGMARFYRGLQIAVPRCALRNPKIPALDWRAAFIDSWLFSSFAPDNDATEVVDLGLVPFESAEAEWGPPVFDPPDIIQNCYVVHHLGGLAKTRNRSDIDGMRQRITVTPSRLSEFLSEQLAAGNLKYTE